MKYMVGYVQIFYTDREKHCVITCINECIMIFFPLGGRSTHEGGASSHVPLFVKIAVIRVDTILL